MPLRPGSTVSPGQGGAREPALALTFPVRDSLSVLYLEDQPSQAAQVVAGLQKQWPKCIVEVAERGSEFEAKFQKSLCDLVLATDSVPDYSGAQALAFVRARNPDVPFILIASRCPEGAILDAVQQSGTDYVLRDNMAFLGPAVTRALNEAAERSKLRAAEEALRRAQLKYRTLFGRSPYPVVVLDTRDDLPVEFNDEACRLMGYSRNEFARLRIADYAVHENAAQVRARKSRPSLNKATRSLPLSIAANPAKRLIVGSRFGRCSSAGERSSTRSGVTSRNRNAPRQN